MEINIVAKNERNIDKLSFAIVVLINMKLLNFLVIIAQPLVKFFST
jgi:hypothetical protein